MRGSPVAVGLALGVVVDAALGDPRRGHPVAAFGRLGAALEGPLYRDDRRAGVTYLGVLVGGACLAGTLASRRARTPAAHAALTAAATWAVLGGTTLRREADTLTAQLLAQDLPAARRGLAHLCGRDAADLTAAGLARGIVESVAENTSDAVVAPLLWGVVAGVPGLLAYRAVNTLDAMVGHHSERYSRFGWASARLDDLANLVPSRISALLTIALAPLVGGRTSAALRVWRRDGHRHLSPNAGQVEAAFAGALGRTLGGPVSYDGRLVVLPLLGDGPAPAIEDIGRAGRLSAAVTGLAAGLAVIARLLLDHPARVDRP